MGRRLMVLALVVGAIAGCTTGRGRVVDAGPGPTRPPGPGAEATAPTTAAGPGAGAPGATTSVSLWFTKGESLHEVKRAVPKVTRIGAEAVKALLAGPTAEEARGGVATAVPAGTRFLGLVIDAGVARVDLSRQFDTSGGGLGLSLRLAQVTCTLGQFGSVRGVRFAIDGQLVSVLSGDGAVVDKPVTCEGYRRVLARGPQAPDAPGIWPFTTAAEADAAGRPDPAFGDPVATAREFAVRYVGIDDPVTFGFSSTAPDAGEVGVGPRLGEGSQPLPEPRATTSVAVQRLGRSGRWTVVGAHTPSIEVDGPRAGDRLTSPARLTGRATAFEGTVNVSVRQDGMLAGSSLGDGVVTGRGDGVLGPFSGQVAFRASSAPGGALVFAERSAADGQGVLRATVVRVSF